MVNTIVLANMNARGHLDKSRVKKLERVVGDKGKVFRTYKPEELENVVSHLHTLNPESIILDGGDGTQLTFFTLLMQHWPQQIEVPPIGLFQGGTWNIKAKYAGIKKRNYIKYLEHILDSSPEELSLQDMGLISVKDNTGKQSYGFTYGMGMPVTLLEEYYTAKHLKLFKLVSMVGQLIGSSIVDGEFYKRFADKQSYTIMNGSGKSKDVELLGLMAQTIPSIGLPRSNIFYKATHTEKFHVLGVKLDIIEMVASFPLFYIGKANLLDQKKLINIQTDHYSISSEKPFPYQVNGDLEFMEEKFKANSIELAYGRKVNIIKHIG